jgi:hypothetical protein
MALHNEIEFEDEVCEHLAGNGWLYAEKDAAVTGKFDVREFSKKETA